MFPLAKAIYIYIHMVDPKADSVGEQPKKNLGMMIEYIQRYINISD